MDSVPIYTPPDRPPTVTTQETSRTYIFGLNAGTSYKWSYLDYPFTTPGCDHQIYAWVDRDNTVAESNEGNNLTWINLCVGTPPPQCQQDTYESDNVCSAAPGIFPDGTHQIRNLCPVGDEDWVRLDAQAGITYTIEATYTGADTDLEMSLYDRCGEQPSLGGGQRIVWTPNRSGSYYVKIRHLQDSYGPNTGYELSVTASTNCPNDNFEPDDECVVAHDLIADGVRQRHQFCMPRDQDWLRFEATAGATYVIGVDHTGPDADSIVELRRSCDEQQSFGGGHRFEWTAPEGGSYYLQLRNQDPERYGPNARYEIRLESLNCSPDESEPDNNHTQAKAIAADGTPQTHDICPAGDQDWLKFDAQAGTRYTAETFNLGSAADPEMCLYDRDGATKLVCDDDGTGGRASRLTWQAPASGTYFLAIQHHRPGVGGPDTRYDVKLITELCSRDAYEIDDSAAASRWIPANGSLQAHDFCPAGDNDWARFDVPSGGSYIIETSNLGPSSDTVLYLYGRDGFTELAQNDDYGNGQASRIVYSFTSSGTYYVRVHHRDPSLYGANTRYDLSVRPGTEPPTPTPTATPSPTPTPTPTPTGTPSSVKTLIVTNRARLEAIHGASEVASLWDALLALAKHASVRGQIIQVESHNSAAQAYGRWEGDQLSTQKANEVASAVRALIFSHIENTPEVEYIVLVGDDRIIPFRRIPDRTRYPEDNYKSEASPNTTQWAALRDGMTLTDDYYADKEPTPWQGRELYIPDYAIGRLVETPATIKAFIQTFLVNDGLAPGPALVTGYDFVDDGAQEMCDLLKQDLREANVDCTLIGWHWSADQLREKQLNAQPPFTIQSINGHANHTTEGAPQGSVSANEVANWGNADLSRALIYTVGCHSGYNDTGGGVVGLDLTQAFARRRANYVANTGYGWGYRGLVGLSERLMRDLTKSLLTGTATTMGEALAAAKQRYYAETSDFNEYDEKILAEATLYGLPMVRVTTPASLPLGDEFPSVSWTPQGPISFGALTERQVDLSLIGSFGALDLQQTGEGSFYALDGHTQRQAGEPVQPLFFGDVSQLEDVPVHGAVLAGGTYRDEPNFSPLISYPVNEYFQDQESAVTGSRWIPAVPHALRDVRGTGSAYLSTVLGQFHSGQGVERTYDHLLFDVYYSDSPDRTPPQITFVGGIREGAQVEIKVAVSDPSGIHRVLVAHSDGRGTWYHTDLSYNAGMAKWLGAVPATQAVEWFVQTVDRAGNVGSEANKGAYYRTRFAGGDRRLFIPSIHVSR